jgi:hypothetical protein
MAAKAVRSTDIGMSPSVPPSDIYIDKQGSGNLRTAVQLPEGEDLNEWIAVHGQLSSSSSFSSDRADSQLSISSIMSICYMVPYRNSVPQKR